MRLTEFAEYLNQAQLFIPLDIARFKKELSEGLFFKSNIPVGYGAGSSGALVAAIFDRYCMVREGKGLSNLKKTFSQMEGFFHGMSSGTDPLICYLNKAIILSKTEINKVDLPELKKPFRLFLLDTGIERSGTYFIEYFLEKNKESTFVKKLNNNYLPVVDSAINNYLNSQWKVLFENFNSISSFQFNYLNKLIPNGFSEIWKEGIKSDYFKLKICGAGGGGFILGMTNDFEKMELNFTEYKILKI